VTPLSFRFREALPHFGHFISFESFLVGLDKVVCSLGDGWTWDWPFIGLRRKEGDISPRPRVTLGALVWTVYVLRCKTGELYTGCTTDLERRVREHNSGAGSKFTRSRLPVDVVYTEELRGRSEALRRERAIKAMKRSEKLLLVGHAALATSA
jgi:putative endonuclease